MEDGSQRTSVQRPSVFLALGLSLAIMSGCAAVMTGAGGTSAGRPIGSESRTSAQASQDARISTLVRSRLGQDPDLSPARLGVSTNRGVVTLQGTVQDFMLRDRAVNVAGDVEGVVRVRNQLVVRSR